MCTELRSPCSALARVGGLKVVSGSSAGERIIEFAEVADLLVLCDSTDHRWPSLIERRRAKGLRTVFEINDQFLALQAWNSTAAFFHSPEHRALTLEIASSVMVFSSPTRSWRTDLGCSNQTTAPSGISLPSA